MGLSFDISGAQILGAREYQEDEFLISNLVDENDDPAALIAVADGMGGHAAGNVAANMAVQSFNKHIRANYPGGNIHELLHESVLRANASIAETINETPALQGMGCTIVAAVIDKGEMWWVSVGDSHLYLLRSGKIYKKNADHSYGGFLDRLRASGHTMEPQPGLSRNVLMSALTGEDIVEIDCPEEPLSLLNGDRLLFCSDGLDTLSDGKIIHYSRWGTSSKECVEELLKGVTGENKTRQDNTTTLVVDVHSGVQQSQQKHEESATSEGMMAKDREATLQLDPAARKEYFERMYRKAVSTASVRRPLPERPTRSLFSGLLQLPTHSLFFRGLLLLLLLVLSGVAFYLLSEPIFLNIEFLRRTEPFSSTLETAPETPASPLAKSPREGPAEGQYEDAYEPLTVKPAAPPQQVQIISDPLSDGDMGPELVLIEGGTFRMGGLLSIHPEESPAHTVRIKNFAISIREITVKEYLLYLRATGDPPPGIEHTPVRENHPVHNLSRNDAISYARWLSETTGRKYRLPSEAEWEYAASAGTRRYYWWGPEMVPGRAHCSLGCGSVSGPQGGPLPVGRFMPNPYGLYDTAGNVSEWIHDCWHPNYQGAPNDGSSWQSENCRAWITRGGSYESLSGRLGHRNRERRISSTIPYPDVGIRVVRELD